MRGINASHAWFQRLNEILDQGHSVSPRGQVTLELTQPTLVVDMNYPAVVCPERQLGYQFMAAEAFWILTGDDRVSTIEPYNKAIAQFSDDGERFFGAYGPRVAAQLPHVLRAISGDNDTRQAWMRLWRDNPPPTKDVPCTIALGWSVRSGAIHCHAYMRSSDVWLGIPYDVFNFSILSMYVRHQLRLVYGPDLDLDLGDLYLTAASSHLYERNFEAAQGVVDAGNIYPCPKAGPTFEAVLASLRARMAAEPWDAGVWRFWRPIA